MASNEKIREWLQSGIKLGQHFMVTIEEYTGTEYAEYANTEKDVRKILKDIEPFAKNDKRWVTGMFRITVDSAEGKSLPCQLFLTP